MNRADYLRWKRRYMETRDPFIKRELDEYDRRKHPRSPAEVTQIRFRVIEVVCEPLAARITLAECIRRASARTASGAGRGFLLHESCKVCKLREVHRAMSPWIAPPYRAFNVAREQKQRAARQRLWKAGALEPVRTIDGADE